MTDRILRELERARLHDPALEARVLRARMRIDALFRAHVHLAAYAGDPVAEVAAGTAAASTDSVRDWVAGLARWGKVPCARALLELAREVRHLGQVSHVESDAWRTATGRLARWIECPCPTHVDLGSVVDRHAWGYQRAATERVETRLVGPTQRLLDARTRRAVREAARRAVTSVAESSRPQAVTARIRVAIQAWALPDDA